MRLDYAVVIMCLSFRHFVYDHIAVSAGGSQQVKDQSVQVGETRNHGGAGPVGMAGVVRVNALETLEETAQRRTRGGLGRLNRYGRPVAADGWCTRTSAGLSSNKQQVMMRAKQWHPCAPGRILHCLIDGAVADVLRAHPAQ
jgi:hypothetical protein